MSQATGKPRYLPAVRRWVEDDASPSWFLTGGRAGIFDAACNGAHDIACFVASQVAQSIAAGENTAFFQAALNARCMSDNDGASPCPQLLMKSLKLPAGRA